MTSAKVNYYRQSSKGKQGLYRSKASLWNIKGYLLFGLCINYLDCLFVYTSEHVYLFIRQSIYPLVYHATERQN